MARITKKDPKDELAKFLRHDEERNQQKEDRRKVSSQLPSLQRERRRSLLTRLGSIIVVCLLIICALAYYVSPYADVSTVRIYGAGDLDAKSLVRASEITASDKVLDSLRSNQKISRKLSKTFPEVGSVKLTLSGLNTLNFKVKERAERKGVSLQSKDKIVFPPCKVVSFKIGKTLRDSLNGEKE